MMPNGELLWAGCCEFPAATGADGAMRYMDVPRLAIGAEQQFLLSVRNGSEDEDIAVAIGQMLKGRPYPREIARRQACVAADVASTVTTVKPHKLQVGDRIAFEGTGGGVTADLYYWVIPSALMTDFVFQISATPGGAAVNLNADAANVFTYVASPVDALPAVWGSAALDTYVPMAAGVYHGLAKGDAIVSDVGSDVVVAGTVYYVIDVGLTARYFSLNVARGGSPALNIGSSVSQQFRLAPEFYEHTSFTVGKWAAGTYLLNVAGMVSKLVQGWPYGADGGRICVSPGDQTYDAFCVSAEIRRA